VVMLVPMCRGLMAVLVGVVGIVAAGARLGHLTPRL
jgi:hypothetical protein